MASADEKILAASQQHPIKAGYVFKYGTAGFRMNSDLLDGVTFRVALLATLRSRQLLGQAIGIMITASHNPPVDNGVKIVDPLGEMLEQEWEAYATTLVNCATDEAMLAYYHKLAATLKINLGASARVVYGRDTRPSGHTLALAVADALEAADATGTDYKIVTTPQLHYLTRCVNTKDTPLAYGRVSEAGYYEKLSDAFIRALRGRKVAGELVVDCANGVGGPKLHEMLKYLPKDKVGLDVTVVNDDVLRPEILNLEVCLFLSILCIPVALSLSLSLSLSPYLQRSVVPITSKPSSVPPPRPSQSPACAAARTTATLTA